MRISILSSEKKSAECILRKQTPRGLDVYDKRETRGTYYAVMSCLVLVTLPRRTRVPLEREGAQGGDSPDMYRRSGAYVLQPDAAKEKC